MITITRGKFLIHYHSDYSGDAKIVNKETKESMEVPCDFILEWAAGLIQQNRISKLEQTPWRNFLNHD
jgi:hypothetical protein